MPSRPTSHEGDWFDALLRILSVPQHTESKAVDVALEISHETITGLAVPVKSLPGDIFEAIDCAITVP